MKVSKFGVKYVVQIGELFDDISWLEVLTTTIKQPTTEDVLIIVDGIDEYEYYDEKNDIYYRYDGSEHCIKILSMV